jgi:hypothetical protein
MRFLLNLFALPSTLTNSAKPFSATPVRRLVGLVLLSCCCCPVALFANTYYLAPASLGGNDANNGWSIGKPWLTPKHNLSCGDVIIALASTAYNSESFNSGHWGNVYCPANNNVAWLKCETFAACVVYSGAEGINVDHSYWGVQGFEVNVWGGNQGFCFGAAPSGSNWVNIHHIIFANNIANGCKGGGFVSFNYGIAGVDYFNVIGNIVYNAISGNAQCFNGISIYQPVQADWAAGTHIYVAGNYTWGNYEADPCGGVQAWGGDGIMFDTLDGSHGMPYPYQAQVVAEQNISVGNGGHGIEVQNNVAGSGHAKVILSNNTVWGNELMSWQQYNHLCAEVLLNSAFNVEEKWNLVATRSQTACVGNPNYAFSGFEVNGTDWVHANLAFAYNRQFEYFYWGPNFSYSSDNVLGVNPWLANAYVPGPPACGGATNVANCMSWVANNFKPTNSSVAWAGFHTPSYSPASAPLFPTWVCNANLPPGLVTKPC